MSTAMDVFLIDYVKRIRSLAPGKERDETLQDLAEFYGEHPVVQELLLIISVSASSDCAQNGDYSHRNSPHFELPSTLRKRSVVASSQPNAEAHVP